MISMHTVEWLYSYLTNQNFNMIEMSSNPIKTKTTVYTSEADYVHLKISSDDEAEDDFYQDSSSVVKVCKCCIFPFFLTILLLIKFEVIKLE